jgi:hypothetical protein
MICLYHLNKQYLTKHDGSTDMKHNFAYTEFFYRLISSLRTTASHRKLRTPVTGPNPSDAQTSKTVISFPEDWHPICYGPDNTHSSRNLNVSEDGALQCAKTLFQTLSII